MKKLLSLIVLIFSSLFLFAEPGEKMYEKAPKSVQQAIQKCDSLIKDAKYSSAYRALQVDENVGKNIDYLIYKRTEVITNWFSYSLMHQMFDIKDFNSEEELYEYRHNISYGTEEMSFSMRFGSDNPEEWFEKYEKEYGSSPRINLAKAQYYFDVSQRYRNQWLKSYDELLQLAYENYKIAINAGFYNTRALSNYSESALFTRRFEDAYNGYSELVQYEKNNGTLWYNLTSSCMYLGRYTEAITYAKNAIENPEPEEANQIDAYVLLSDAYEYSGDSENAELVLIDAVKKYPKQPYPIQTLGQLYYSHNKTNESIETFYNCIKCEYDNYKSGSVIPSFIQYLYSKGDDANCFKLLDKVEPLIKKDNLLLGQIYYLRAQLYSMKGNTDEAKKCLKKAEDSAKKAKNTDFLNELEYFKQSLGQ